MSETRRTTDRETTADVEDDVGPDDPAAAPRAPEADAGTATVDAEPLETDAETDKAEDGEVEPNGADEPTAGTVATEAKPAEPAEGEADDVEGDGEGDEAGRVEGGLDRWLSRTRVLVPLYLAMAAVCTWPLTAHLTDSLPYGTEDNPTVQLFNLWTMRWNQDRLGHLFVHYWDAPIFHPTKGSFALSEPQPLTGLVFSPLSWVSGNPVLAINLVLLAVFAANGWAAARLARRLGAAPGAAVLAGVLAEGSSFVAAQMGVLQLTAIFPLFLLVEAIVRWAPVEPRTGTETETPTATEANRRRRRSAAEIGLWLAVTFLTCGYYGLFAVVGIGAPTLILARRRWLTRSRLVDLAVAAGVFAVLAMPVLVGQGRITADYERPDEVVKNLSAGSDDFWQLEERANGAGVLPWVRERTTGNGLYPGTALLALGLAGAVVAYRRLHAADGEDGEDRGDSQDENEDDDRSIDLQRLLIFLVVGAILARGLSLGLNLSFGPYRPVRALVPGFESLRSPFRFAILTEVFLVALAAFALDALWRWRPRGTARRWGALAALVVVVAGVVEVGIMPVSLFRVDQDQADWATWIEENPDRPGVSGDGSFAYLPFPPTGSVVDYEPTAWAMLQSLNIGVPTVNGYSGLFPTSYDELEGAMRNYPSDEADALLHEHGVSYLVVDRDWLDDRVRPWLEGRFRRAFEGEDAVVYEVL